MGKFDGKKLLVLGSNTMAADIVKYAKDNGAYTIVTDYFPVERSTAKQLADEALNISTADTDYLMQYCVEKKVDGIFAGISEFNLIRAQKMSQQLGLRFYCSEEQWNLIQRKDAFDQLCRQYCVEKPECYFSGEESAFYKFDWSIYYPAVLKPVDGSSSQGVRVCNNKDELVAAAEFAFRISPAKRVIVQQYVQGNEFTAHYTICNGKAALACVDNRYPVAVHDGNVTTIPIARVYPSLFLKDYVRYVNPAVVNMLENIGLSNAVIFVQGIYNQEENRFYIFEAGLRSAAELPCRFLETITGQNHFFMLLDYILLGTIEYDLDKESPDLNGFCCAIVSFASPGGKVGKILGYDEVIRNTPQIVCAESRYPVGSTVPDGNTLRQIVIRFVLKCKDREELSKLIEKINNTIRVTDEAGRNMIVGMEPQRVFGVV